MTPSQRLVLVQFALFVAMGLAVAFTPVQSQPAAQIVGGILMIGGVLLVLAGIQVHRIVNHAPPNVTPDPNTEAKLVTIGLYGRMRHPIYSGVLLVAFGLALLHGGAYPWVVMAALYIFFYTKSRYEEALLLHTYPAYQAYMQRTGRFLPRF